MGRLIKKIATAMTVVLGAMTFTVAASAALAPEIDDAAATFSVSSPPGAPVQCAGAVPTDNYATSSGTATGTSTETSTGGRFGLTGAIKIKSIQTAKLNLAGLTPASLTGSFELDPTGSPTRRLVGTFKAVAKINLADNSGSGRGFISANYQKKVGTTWKNTGDALLANAEFAIPAHALNAPTVTNGSIGGAATVGDYSLKTFSHC